MAKIAPFEAHHERYEQWFEAHLAAYVSELLALRPFVPLEGHGLEIGVGTGRFAGPLGVPVGLDPSNAMLTRAAARGVETVKGTAEALPFPDESFACALIVTTICFVDSPDKMIAEAHRVLRPNGTPGSRTPRTRVASKPITKIAPSHQMTSKEPGAKSSCRMPPTRASIRSARPSARAWRFSSSTTGA